MLKNELYECTKIFTSEPFNFNKLKSELYEHCKIVKSKHVLCGRNDELSKHLFSSSELAKKIEEIDQVLKSELYEHAKVVTSEYFNDLEKR